jgi:serine/threonine protein kinase/tetratricopeptide (TPR) repeat protein
MTSDALRSALEARLGTQYEIESLLGQGGMGSVFRATDRTLRRAVAIKVISGDVALNPELKERFLLEARTVAKLRHPNIVAVYSAGEADGLLYFVMELVPGESLRDLLAREGKVAPERAERILHELAMALDYAHANGIVHRDVKPENILLDRETGRAMLTDFGVARALENSGNMTSTGMILGSPRYMSPEQATGEATLDGRSDLYALALVGYEMFTGKPVVDSGNVAGMLVKHLTETPKPVAEAVVGVPEGAAVAIDRALAKDRDQRWANGREMAEVVAATWTPTPGSGATRAIGSMKAKKATPKAAMGGAFIAIFMSLLTVFISTRDKDGGDPRKSYAVLPFEIQSGNADVQWLRDGAVNMLTLALAQWTDLQVMDYERTLKYVADAGVEARRVDLERAQEIAKRGGAGTLVMGQVSTTQDSLIVVARLYDVKSGKSINTATRAAALTADPRPLFDDLARYLLDVAGGQTSASVDVARQTTTSITAYRSYLDGVRFLNSWRLQEADSALQAAIRADSTFALAWHKRALALGWGSGQGQAYLGSAQRAVDLADRLPPRQQALVRGHFALAQGIYDSETGGLSTAKGTLREAQRIYEELLASDSLVAEGWYGLGDAYFHDPGDSTNTPAQISARVNRSILGFRRAIEIDSTFHLAYSHLVQQYQGLSQGNSGGVLDGDTVLMITSQAMVDSLGGVAELARRRDRAREIGFEMARGWSRADPDAPTAYFALANSFFAAGKVDSAIATLDRALLRPSLRGPAIHLQKVSFLTLADSAAAFTQMRDVYATATNAEMLRLPANERITALAMSINAAAAVGNASEIDKVITFYARVDSIFPFTTTPLRTVMNWYASASKAAITGVITSEQRRILAEGTRRIGSGSQGIQAQLAATSGAVVYAAYLLTGDTLFSNTIRRMPGANLAQHTDLDALEALARGDTARAREIAATYTPPDSLRTARFGFGGQRAYGRALVLAAVGNRDWAIRYLEALHPSRFNAQGLSEPGFAFFTRSFITRAQLYEQEGNRTKAIAAYEEYLRRTELGDSAVEAQRRAARASVARLKDAAR